MNSEQAKARTASNARSSAALNASFAEVMRAQDAVTLSVSDVSRPSHIGGTRSKLECVCGQLMFGGAWLLRWAQAKCK